MRSDTGRRVGSLLLFIGSVALSLVAALLLLQGYEALLGADIPYSYFVEPRPGLWEPDAEIGFRNKANSTRRIFGKRVSRTNSAGFRAPTDLSPEKAPGSFRIFGVGDSVMWGSGLRQEDSFLEMLKRLMAEDLPDLEVINAGVVGYSTYQERLFFEKRVVPYAPDLILVNFCVNDFLPTEDPFGNVREIYLGYLQSLDDPDAPGVAAVSSLLDSPHAWSALDRASRNPGTQRSMREVLIDRPIVEMARIASERGIRIVYLLIPPTIEKRRERILRLQVRKTLAEYGIEYIDFSDMLIEDKEIYGRVRSFEEGRVYRAFERSGFRDLLDALSLGALDPIPSLRNISRLRGMERAHESRNYIDHIGHPSRSGSRIIAEAIHHYLQAHPSSLPSTRR